MNVGPILLAVLKANAIASQGGQANDAMLKPVATGGLARPKNATTVYSWNRLNGSSDLAVLKAVQ